MNCSDKYSDIFGKNISSEVNKYLLSIGTFFLLNLLYFCCKICVQKKKNNNL